MNRSICCGIALAAVAMSAVAGQYKYSDNSVLAQGNWIRITVSDGGIYELSDSELTAMGLNPANVSVYGYGGRSTPYTLVLNGNNNVPDDLTQVPVHRIGDKIYFYAQGVSNPRIGVNGYAFDDRNIFTDCGHYFLTDSRTVQTMEYADVASDLQANAVDCSSGYGYRINNVDHYQGRKRENAGIQYWDYIMAAGEARSWNVTADYPEEGRQATLTVKSKLFNPENAAAATFTLSLNGNAQQVSYSNQYTSSEGRDVQNSATMAMPAGNSVQVGVKLDSGNNEIYFDWWMLNYPKKIPAGDTGMVQQRLGVTSTGNGYITVGKDWVVMDVTNPDIPVLLDVRDGKAYFPAGQSGHDLMVFSPSKRQLAPTESRNVANQNLHAADDCSLLIITVPEFRGYAEEIASLHREHDGIGVLVTTTEEVYNEFTSGNPHPMAYRMLVKMLYERSGEPLRNVLLIGPIRSDARNINSHPDMPEHFLIGMQEGCANTERVAALTMGFYGNTNDNLLPTAQSDADMHVGVGLLPIKNSEDGKLAVSKIHRYLEALSHGEMAWIVNEVLGMSCTGDSHMHDDQAKSLRNTLRNQSRNVGAGYPRHTLLMSDFYPTSAITDLINRSFNQGKLFSYYIGHASASGLGGFYHTPDFLGLDNNIPLFMIFAGCDLMLPDHGASGICAESVLHAPNALVGAIGSTRMAWANQNFNLANALEKYMFTDRAGKVRSVSTTFGEAFAAAMSDGIVDGTNKLVYEYIGDPALIIPVPLRGIKSLFGGSLESYRAGDVVLVEGEIISKEGDKPFNGTAVAKLCKPTQTRSQIEDPAYNVTFDAELLTSVRVNVVNGKFTAKLPMPAESDKFLSRGNNVTNMNLYLSAYDPSQRLAASADAVVPMATADDVRVPGADDSDIIAPVVSVAYDADSEMLEIDASDNVALLPGIGNGAGLSLSIDGKPVTVPYDGVGFNGVGEYSAKVYVGDYSIGKQHTVTYSCTDMLGNSTDEKTLRFTLQGDPVNIGLTMVESYGIDRVTFRVDASGRGNLVLTVFDSAGKKVFEEQDVDDEVIWDCGDVRAGVYRAAVRAADGRKCRSEWVVFSVID